MPENSSNITFIETIFGEDAIKGYPNYNYRLRLAGLTEFEPYISEAPRLTEETDEQYSARVLTSGRYFGEQEILIDDLVHSDININGLNLPSTFYDGRVPKTLLFLEKCKLINDGKEYEVTSKNLNDLNYVKSHPPTVVFPVDLSKSDKGYVVYRKTTSVNKGSSRNAKLMESVSGWYPITGFSNNDIRASIDGGSAKAIGFTDNNNHLDNVYRGEATQGSDEFYPWRPTSSPDGATHYTGYESFQNELFTSYKIIDSGVLVKPPSSESELTRDRTINVRVDPSKSFSLERKVTRKSHNNTSNVAEWENIQHNVSFPYKDEENLSDYIDTNVNFEVSGIYDVVEPTGNHSDGRDYFEVPIVEDWGKSTVGITHSNREKTDELVFRSGENIKVAQRSTYKESYPRQYDQYASIDIHFNPYSTGVSGSITGANNEKNFYQLEYQLLPNVKDNQKLHYEKVSSSDASNISVGDEVFYNTGQKGGVYNPVSSNIFGGTPSIIPEEKGALREASMELDISNIGGSYQIGITGKIEPEIIPDKIHSGVGYSYFTSGEKYLVVPKGGYSTLFSDAYLEFDSAGENRRTFFHGEQSDDIDSHYTLAEFRSFNNYYSESQHERTDEFIYNKEREVRINKQELCLGDSSTDLPDVTDSRDPKYLLDLAAAPHGHKSIPTYKNASILNIDSSDGSIKLSNFKNNKLQFQERSNLFFEKNYVASQTILATGQKQSIEPLKQFIEDGKVYYLERDIYIDSDVRTQANTSSPSRRSDEEDLTFSPLSVSPNTPNPEAVGEEKLYLTQVYHNNTEFPYKDFDYYNYQPTIAEEFTYVNSEQSIIDDFQVKNVSSERSYTPGSYRCSLSDPGYSPNKDEGFSILMNSGYDDAHAAGHNISTGSLTSDSQLPMTFTPRDRNVYYEVQVRPDSISDWTTLSYAVDAHGDDTGNITVGLTHDTLITNKTEDTEIRVVEWAPGAIVDDYEGIGLSNESPDSLVLKSTGGIDNTTTDRIYDASKTEHSINKNPESAGAIALIDEDWDGDGDDDIKAFSFPGEDDQYLSIPSHRSFNIQNGEFSLEFWIKAASETGTIFERENGIKLSIDASTPSSAKLTVRLKGDSFGVVIGDHDIGATSSWKHIALAKVKSGKDEYRLCLYVDGEAQVLKTDAKTNEKFKYIECGYDDYSFDSTKALTIGKGLNAELYQVRFYVGKSLHKGKTTDDSKTDFKVDSGKIRYRVLKLKYNRAKSAKNDWIINRNQFDNVGPPDNYLDHIADMSDETTFHAYEWLQDALAEGTNEYGKLETDSRTRALVNYLQGYAYRAPNNPHINKNYEGRPIFRDSSGNISAFDGIVLDNYFFNVRDEARSTDNFNKGRAPYLYEFLDRGKSMRSMRFAKKGGEDTSTIPLVSSDSASYSSASRLRITRYVYRLYTKHAVVVGDVGHKESRGSQSGWDYQLQYSIDEGSNWTDVDSTESHVGYPMFYNDLEGLRPNSFDNIDNVTLLPTLIIKTDITDKYKPEDIEIRIKKKQNISISDGSLNTQVLKKVNLLPMEVTIPTSGTLLDLTQKAAGDKGQMEGAIDSPLDSQHYSVYDQANQVAVHLDSDTTYVVYKDPNESILFSSDVSDTLKVENVTMALDKTSTVTYTDIEDRKPYEVAGMTGLRVYGGSVSSLETVKSVIGPKPSGLSINRVEKSHGSIKTGENVILDARQTKVLYDPSITGSHLDELENFDIYTANDTAPSESLINFTCSSFTTGLSDSSIETGVSGVSYKPAYDFLNSPVMTGEFTVTADDIGKTFLVSGTNASGIFIGNNYHFDIVNIGSSTVKLFDSPDAAYSSPALTSSTEKARTIRVDSDGSFDSSGDEVSGVITVLPDAKVGQDIDESLVLVEDVSKVSVSNSNIDSACTLVNISTGDCSLVDGIAGRDGLGSLSGVSYNASAQRLNHIDSGVIVIDHDKIVLTENDVDITGVIDTNSTLVLPSGFAGGEHVSFLNATDDEIKVVSESGYKIDSKSVDYIPRQTTRKFTCSKSESGGKTIRNWSTSNIEVIRYNQLNVKSSDNKEVFIHNEDVDVRVNSDSTTEGFNFSVVRSQVNDISFDFLRDERTPTMRIFIDGHLEYSAPPGVIGVRVEKKSYGWSFTNISAITGSQIIIDSRSHGKIFSYSGSSEKIQLKFKKDTYPTNFEFFFISAHPSTTLAYDLESEDNVYKFNDQEDSGFHRYVVDNLSNKDLVRVGKSSHIIGQGSGGENKFYVEFIGADPQNKNSNKYKFNQPSDAKERVLISRNEEFAVELPTLKTNLTDFDYNRGFALTFVNAAESLSNVLYPAAAISDNSDITSVTMDSLEGFSASTYDYFEDEDVEIATNYDNFRTTPIESFSSPALSDEDFLVLDGSLSNVALRSFFSEGKVNKYAPASEGEAFQLSKVSLTGSNKFNLSNHGLVTNHKMVFPCDRLTLVDYYFETSDWDSAKDTFNGTIGSHSIAEGDTLLVYDTQSDTYFRYVDNGTDGSYRYLVEDYFTIPEPLIGTFNEYYYTFQWDTNGPLEAGKMFIRIGVGSNKESGGTPVGAGNIYDLYSNGLSAATAKTTSNSIPFTFAAGSALDADVDEADLMTQTLFVKVVNENEFLLYSDKALSVPVTYASVSDYTFFSETFYTDALDYGKVSIINLGGSQNIKAYSDDSTIVSSLGNKESVELFSASDGSYTQGGLAFSGVHTLIGLDGSVDSLDINKATAAAASKNQIITSGVFTAQAALTDNDFDNDYFINGGLDSVTIKNTQDSSTDTLLKNRAYKHDGNGAFTLQDQSVANRDVIYYPKNEIHIPDRANLGIDNAQSQFTYTPAGGTKQALNFVFCTPNEDEEYNEDREIILPDAYTNLKQVAVVNMTNMPITARNFSRTASVVVNANAMLVISNADLSTTNTAYSLYGSLKEDEDDGLYHSVSGYRFYLSSDSVIVSDGKLYRNYEKTKSKRDRYSISREGDIILDYDTHNGKKIVVDSQPNFLRPYLYKADGSGHYLNGTGENQIFRPISASEYFNFQIANISTSSLLISVEGDDNSYNPGIVSDLNEESELYRDGKLHPMVAYSVELDNFSVYPDDNPYYFRHISAVDDEQSVFNINHSSTSLDSSIDYHVFGKQLSLSLYVYYDKITSSDAEEINLKSLVEEAYTLSKNEEIDLTSDSEYYKIVGFGAENVSNINIINTVYENIKISSVVAVDAGSNNLSDDKKNSIAAKILSYFPEETEEEGYYLLSLDGDADFGIGSPYISQTDTANYLNKNKVLSLGIQDVMTSELGSFTGPFGFFFDDENKMQPLANEYNPYQITLNDTKDENGKIGSNVRLLKEKSVSLDIGVAEGSTFKHVFADQQNISLPSRQDMLELNNIYFTVVNASRNSSVLSCPEGASVFANATIAAGAAKKIKYSDGAFSDVTGDDDGVEVVTLSNAIFSSDSGVFITSKQNSVSGALAIHKDVGSIKIINNSKSPFHVKNYNASKTIEGASTYAIPAYAYCDFKVDSSENYIIDSDNRNVKLHTLKDGAVEISASIHKDKVVLFDAENVKAFNVTDDAYFTTTFVPLIIWSSVDSKLQRGGFTPDLSRLKKWSTNYALYNKYDDRIDISHSKPVKFDPSLSSKMEIKIPVCNMFEFILDESVKDKVVLSNRYYDYIFKHDQRTEFCLYNKDRSPVNLRKLDSNDNNFKDMGGDENDYEVDLLTGSTKCKIMISCAQEGTGDPTVTELQSYTEVAKGGDAAFEETTLYKNFYLNKPFYDGKIVIFKDPFDIIYSAKKDNTLIGNISNSQCRIFENKLRIEDFESDGVGSLPANKSMRALMVDDLTEDELEGRQIDMLRPKHFISTKNKVTVITQPADIEYTGTVDGLKIINASSKAVNITAGGKINKIYSSEKTAFTNSEELDYNLCPRFNRRDWFISLKDVHIPHLQKDPNYFNEEEQNAEWIIKKKESFNVNYVGTRYKFSNIFRTNLHWPSPPFIESDGLSGYESISNFDNPYKFGVVLYGDKKDSASSLLDYGIERKEIYYDKDSSDYILNGLKISWDMPARTIGYSISTGHERICYSKEFNERTGLVTVSGIESGKYYILEDFDGYYQIGDETVPVKYDFAPTAVRGAPGGTAYGSHKYTDVVSKEFFPVIWYNGKSYWPGEKFIGVAGKENYQIHYNYFAVVKASLFKAEGVDESDLAIKDIVEKETEALNEEIANKTEDDDYVDPTWTKVSEDYQKENFLNGRISNKVANGASYELIQGKKLKDIEGAFKKDYFEFKIPKDPDLDFSESFSDVTWTNKDNSTDKDYVLRVKFEDNKIDSPGYEYEIKSSLSFTNNTGKVVLSISLGARDSLPFVADGTISSLNLDFNTNEGQEYAMREGGGTHDSGITKTLAIAERDRRKSLKNHQGYSFIPFGINGGDTREQLGLSYNTSKGKQAYKAIRLRLKKLTERKLVFENLKKDYQIGSYLTNESETAGLKYYLDTEVSSISYHDIYRPGGVLRFSGENRNWRTIGATSSDKGDAYLSSNQLVIRGAISNGDAIVFKNSKGSIVGGKPYFARVTSQATSGNETKNTITLLKIFSSDSNLDSFNKVDADIEDTVSSADPNNELPGQVFKVVNYFDLETEDDGTYRSVKSCLGDDSVYGQPDSDSPVTSLNSPIVIGSRTFYLEPPLSEISSERVDSWATNNVLDGNKIRANLELSTAAKHWHGETYGGLGYGTVTGLDPDYTAIPASHWTSESFNIFSSWKNLLYRSNTQIERVSYTNSDSDKTVTLNIKLNTKQGYRYIYKKSSDIKSITLNGSVIFNEDDPLLNLSTSGVIFNTNEDLKVVLNYDVAEDTPETLGPEARTSKSVGAAGNFLRNKVFENLCIVEEADCIIDYPAETDGDNGEDLVGSPYFDYQIPMLNKGFRDQFKQVYESYDTEGHASLLSNSQKGEQLTASGLSRLDEHVAPISSSKDFTADLFFDMGMPAVCKYIYPYVNVAPGRSSLDFHITDFWDGFADGFGGLEEKQRTKPVRIRYDLENSSDGVSWSSVEEGLSHKGNKFSIEREGIDASKKYRIVITGVDISYKDKDSQELWQSKEKQISPMRLPFKWRSIIYDSDLSGDGVLNEEIDLYQHSLSMVENPDIKKSVSFPESGLVKFGTFDFKKHNRDVDLTLPCSRLYMFNLEHNMRANYKDPINRGGISKVMISDSGDNYRTPPTISIAEPDKKPSHFRKAQASSIIENGKLKFIEVINAGTGYADVDGLKTVKVEQYRSDVTPIIIHNLKIANLAGSPNKERGLDRISITDVPGLQLYKATITGNESSLPKEEQEEFGLTYEDTEKIADYTEYEELSESVNRGSVDFMKGSSEDDKEWGDIQAQADRIIKIKNFATSSIEQIKGSQNYGRSMPDEISEIKGTENEYVDGLFQEDQTDSSSVSNRSVEVKYQPGSDKPFIQYEVYPDVDPGEAWALANNSSIVEYRVVNNEIASKTTPWISSFSREDNPSLPQSFGILPGAAITAEVFNTYARAVNFMHKIRVEAPLYAKVRRFSQVEYRYINNPDMAGLTFPNLDSAGDADSSWGMGDDEYDYLTYENKSRINYIVYLDPDSNEVKVAHFSAFESDGGNSGDLKNITDYDADLGSPIWEDVDEELRDTPEAKKFKKDEDDPRTPKSIGLPNNVNIPKKLGVYCNPPMEYGDHPIKTEGLPLPTPINRRAYAYGGELVYKSEVFDVSSELWPLRPPVKDSSLGNSTVDGTQFDPVEGGVLVDIRGSEYIRAGYSNQIVFGCQTRDKPFLSAFLRTVKVWTEYEVVASPDFTRSLPVGLKEKYRPEESKLRCSLVEGRSTCEETKIGEVYKRNGRHSLCEGGASSTYNVTHSYEDLFDLSEGDDVIGPQETYAESSSIVQVPAKGTFKVEPEFDLAMAVYGANEYLYAVRKGIKGYGKTAYMGPCIHYCYPGQIKTLKVSNDPLVFDLKK